MIIACVERGPVSYKLLDPKGPAERRRIRGPRSFINFLKMGGNWNFQLNYRNCLNFEDCKDKFYNFTRFKDFLLRNLVRNLMRFQKLTSGSDLVLMFSEIFISPLADFFAVV